MQSKSIFVSKTFWVAIITLLIGVLSLINQNFLTNLGATPEAQTRTLAVIASISGGLGIVLRFITSGAVSLLGKK